MGEMLDIQEVTFEIYVEDKLNSRQTMEAPKEIIITNFLETAQQIQKNKKPIKLKMIRQDVFWDEFEKAQKTLNNSMEYSNDAFVIWEEERGVRQQ